jgi:fructokinase
VNHVYGAIEAGGTKFVCAVGTGPDDLDTIRIPTTSPEATIQAAVAFLRRAAGGRLEAVGIGSFGPVDLDPGSLAYGHITSTPKPGWAHYDLAGTVGRALGVPVGFDTDVNAAALGESRWGAAQGLSDFLYLTVGTGIGGGALVHGRVMHGKLHPEMGHIRVPHDTAQDPYAGGCPYHGDCLEGLASGPAIEARWGTPAHELPPDHPGWALEARYLALGLTAFLCTLSPCCIILGGGVMQQARLLDAVREQLGRLLNGYIEPCDVVPPLLGARAGVLGALVLAERAKTGW